MEAELSCRAHSVRVMCVFKLVRDPSLAGGCGENAERHTAKIKSTIRSPEKEVSHSTSAAVALLALESKHGADGRQQVRVPASFQHLKQGPEHEGGVGIQEPVLHLHAVIGPEWWRRWPGYKRQRQCWHAWMYLPRSCN